jgi:hypothetical protein
MNQNEKFNNLKTVSLDDPVLKFNQECIEEEIHNCFEKLLSSKSEKRFETFEKRINKKTSAYIKLQTMHMMPIIASLYGEIYSKLREEYSSQFNEEELLKVPRFNLDPISGQYFYVTWS